MAPYHPLFQPFFFVRIIYKLMDFLDARYSSRMTSKEVSDYLGISLRTIKRYERTGKAPKSVIECLLMIGGHCPTFSRRSDFTGWTFGQGYLWSPEGDKFTSGDVRAGKLAYMEIARQHRKSVRDRKQKGFPTADIIPFPTTRIVRKVSTK